MFFSLLFLFSPTENTGMPWDNAESGRKVMVQNLLQTQQHFCVLQVVARESSVSVFLWQIFVSQLRAVHTHRALCTFPCVQTWLPVLTVAVFVFLASQNLEVRKLSALRWWKLLFASCQAVHCYGSKHHVSEQIVNTVQKLFGQILPKCCIQTLNHWLVFFFFFPFLPL